ncbi:MAG: hypothetical protein R3E42_02165 [Burkholderiaceae bacterium]
MITEVSVQEREALVLTRVSAEKLKHYKELAKGYFPASMAWSCSPVIARVCALPRNTAKY